jgi:hypothetical protein
LWEKTFILINYLLVDENKQPNSNTTTEVATLHVLVSNAETKAGERNVKSSWIRRLLTQLTLIGRRARDHILLAKDVQPPAYFLPCGTALCNPTILFAHRFWYKVTRQMFLKSVQEFQAPADKCDMPNTDLFCSPHS